MHGKGTFIWADERKYVGAYVKGQKEGYGEFHFADGKSGYKGEWKGGK